MSATPGPRPAPVLLPFAICTLVWGSTWFVVRDQLSVVPASWSVAFRFALAGVALALLTWSRGEPLRLTRIGWRFAAAVGLTQFVGNYTLVYWAEAHVTSGIVAVVFALLLIPNAVLGRLLLGQRMSGRLLAGSAVAMAGITLLFVHEARAAPAGIGSALTGIGFTLAAVIAASIGNVLQATEAAKSQPMVPMLAVAMLIGAAVDALIGLIADGLPPFDPRPDYWLGVGYLALFGSALTFPLYYHVVRTIGPAKAAYSSVLIPVIAMLISTAFEGYRWTALAIAGAVLAGAGLLIALSARRPAR